MVVAQLVERLLPIPEVRGSNPVIGKIYWTFVYCQLYWKDENKEKRGREWPIFQNDDTSRLADRLYFTMGTPTKVYQEHILCAWDMIS